MGNQINIMTMMFLFYQVMAPFNAILNIDKTFSQFEPDHQKKHLPRTIFILGQCAIFGFLLYKLKGMGLLPTESSDWLAMWPVKEVCLQLLYLRAFANAYLSAYGTVRGWISFVKHSNTRFHNCAACLRSARATRVSAFWKSLCLLGQPSCGESNLPILLGLSEHYVCMQCLGKQWMSETLPSKHNYTPRAAPVVLLFCSFIERCPR